MTLRPIRRARFILPALTEATSPHFRPIKYALFPPLGLATLAAYLPDTVEAELFDGTGTVTLIWLGRTKIPGIRPGTRMAVSGFAALRGRQRVMYNPRYELVGAPDEESELS